MKKINEYIHEQLANQTKDDYVEIGGVKWATKNLGANKITDSGLYFAWGETEGYTPSQVPSQKTFTWDDYKWIDDNHKFTKYNDKDGKTVLDGEDDPVKAAYGGNWRMPTVDDYEALIANTTQQWKKMKNVKGYLFTDKNDPSKTLFFPAAGLCDAEDSKTGTCSEGVYGYYWLSTLYDGMPCTFSFNKHEIYDSSNYARHQGFTVRGVLG